MPVIRRQTVLFSPTHPPHSIPHIIGDQQCAARIYGDADWAALSLALGIEKARQYVDRHTVRHPIGEGHENNLVAACRAAIPRAMLTNERAVAKVFWQGIAARKNQA